MSDDTWDVMENFLDQFDASVTESSMDLIEGLDYDEVISVMMTCLLTLKRMEGQIESQGATDERMRKIVDTAVSICSESLGVPEDQAYKMMMDDETIFDDAVNAAIEVLDSE